MTRTASIVTLALALAGPALAQTEAPDRTQEFLGAQAGVDDALLGSHHYALVLQGAQNIGHLDYTVSKSDDGHYMIEGEIGMAIGPNKNQASLRAKLDAQFAAVEFGEDGREAERGTVTLKRKQGARAGDVWTVDIEHQVEPAAENEAQTLHFEHPHAGAVHEEMASMLLLVRRLDRTTPARYAFETIRWPEPGSSIEEPTVVPLTATVKPAGTVTIGGEAVAATPIEVRKGDGGPILFHVDAEGQLIALGPVGAPIQFVRVESADAAKQNQGETEVREAAGAATPMEAVTIYFKALVQLEPYERLDDVIDWAAIKAEMGAENDGVAAMSTKAIADLLKSEFKKRPLALTQAQLDELLAELTPEVQGETATVAMPGKDDAFTLKRRAGGGWVIDHFPH